MSSTTPSQLVRRRIHVAHDTWDPRWAMYTKGLGPSMAEFRDRMGLTQQERRIFPFVGRAEDGRMSDTHKGHTVRINSHPNHGRPAAFDTIQLRAIRQREQNARRHGLTALAGHYAHLDDTYTDQFKVARTLPQAHNAAYLEERAGRDVFRIQRS